jgi:hypothetical protein
VSCRSCGSDWVTLRGKDCSTCPHCNKVQRCVERKSGRWIDQQETTSCKQCGKSFQRATSTTRIKKVYCSRHCRILGKETWRRKWRQSHKPGVQKQQSRKRPYPTCRECGKQFKRQQGGNSLNIYCSKACFFAARNSGRHAWDKTNIKKASWHRDGWYASAPSVRLMRRIGKAHLSILRAAGGLERQAGKELNRPACEQCGQPCNDGASRFCSYACNKAWRGIRQCRCGVYIANVSAFGASPMCHACKRKARMHERRLSRNTRARVRRGGGYWNPKVNPVAVFERDNWTCYLCHTQCSRIYDPNDQMSATIDHVYPVKHGGDHDWHNVRTACAGCNSKKRDKIKGQMLLRLR